MDFDAVADELYSLPSAEFVSTRTARQKQAKAAGDPGLATRIGKLVKPNAAAWLTNQLVREYPNEVRSLVELGAALREATANLSGEQLRELGKQQHQVVHALVRQAKALAGAAGRTVSDDTARGLEATLHAAMADEVAANQLLAGQLTDTLSRSGFGLDGEQADSAGEPRRAAKPKAPSKPAARKAEPSPSAEDRRLAQLERATRDEDQAREAAEAATSARDNAQADVDDARNAVAEAVADHERLTQALEQASQAQTAAEREHRRVRTQLEKAERAAREAERRSVEASARRQRLSQ